MPLLPAGAPEWAALAVSLALLAVGGWYGARALSGRALPPVEVVDIANPFGPGRYLVGHGGSTPLVNGHMRTLDESVSRFRPWRGQSYAVDFFGLGPWGLRARGWRPADPTAYAIFGAELRAPCDGTVVAAEGGRPDFEVPNEDPVNRLWHLPLWALPGDFHAAIPLWLFAVQILAVSILYTWLWIASGGSLVLVHVFHAASNTTLGLLPLIPGEGADSACPLGLAVALLCGLSAVVALRLRRADP